MAKVFPDPDVTFREDFLCCACTCLTEVCVPCSICCACPWLLRSHKDLGKQCGVWAVDLKWSLSSKLQTWLLTHPTCAPLAGCCGLLQWVRAPQIVSWQSAHRSHSCQCSVRVADDGCASAQLGCSMPTKTLPISVARLFDDACSAVYPSSGQRAAAVADDAAGGIHTRHKLSGRINVSRLSQTIRHQFRGVWKSSRC